MDIFDILSRNTIGFDMLSYRLASFPNGKFPFYDIIRHKDHLYEIQVALAGYDKDEIMVNYTEAGFSDEIGFNGSEKMYNNATLHIASSQQSDSCNVAQKDSGMIFKRGNFVHQGISKREFSLTFALAEGFKPASVWFRNGVLKVTLSRYEIYHIEPKIIHLEIDAACTDCGYEPGERSAENSPPKSVPGYAGDPPGSDPDDDFAQGKGAYDKSVFGVVPEKPWPRK